MITSSSGSKSKKTDSAEIEGKRYFRQREF